MKNIKSLKKQRWFIWAIVSIVVVLGGLACYVYYVAQTNDWATAQINSARAAMVKEGSGKGSPVTQAQAIGLVKSLSEVKAYTKKVSAVHGSVHVVSGQLQYDTGKQAYWPVQVYESLSGHDTTFARYEVYEKTGVIEKLQ